MLRKNAIVILGETLIDLYFNFSQEVSPGQEQLIFSGAPGGAPANVAANLAFMGKPVSLITGFADDPVGSELQRLLLERGIDLSFSATYAGAKTPLALVMNTKSGERAFRLYLNGSALEEMGPLALPVASVDFFHFGSVLMALKGGAALTKNLLGQVAPGAAIRSYDINIRPDILKTNPAAAQEIVSILEQVDVLKISDEDLQWIKKHIDPSLAEPRHYFRYGIKLMAYTRGAAGAILFTAAQEVAIPPPAVQVVDTTGGGDAFVAGLLASLYNDGLHNRHLLASLDEGGLGKIGKLATGTVRRILSQSGAMPPLKH